ncbi:MAG: hypothetical protein AAF927_15370 [Bacteroidota bacterium]
MKKTWFFFLLFYCLSLGLKGQDRIFLLNGSVLKGQILLEETDSVKFVFQDMPDYALNLPSAQIKKLIYDKKRNALEIDSTEIKTEALALKDSLQLIPVSEPERGYLPVDSLAKPSSQRMKVEEPLVPEGEEPSEVSTIADLEPLPISAPITQPKDPKWQITIQLGPASSRARGETAKMLNDSIAALNEASFDENVSYKGGNRIQLGGVLRMDVRRKLNDHLGYRIGVEGLWSSWQTTIERNWQDPEIQFDKNDITGMQWRSLWTNLYLEASLRFAQNYEVYGGLKLGLSVFEQLKRINVHEVLINNEMDDNSWDQSFTTDLEPYRLMPAYRIGAAWVGDNKWGVALEHSRMLRKDPATPYQQGITSLQLVRQF